MKASTKIGGVALALVATASPGNSFAYTAEECRQALSSGVSTVLELEGEWSGYARVDDDKTSFQLRMTRSAAFTSLPERVLIDNQTAAVLADDQNKLCLKAPYGDGVVTLSKKGRGWRGKWIDAEFEADIRLSARKLPAEPLEEEVVFRSADGAELAGLLVMPKKHESDLRAVIWIHGSAPITRETWYYRGRARMAARYGVASLIWDKRGAGASGGGDTSYDMNRLSEDAKAAAELARARPEIADDGVILAGFSQGGWLAPRVAAENQWIAGVLVGAAPGITIAEQNLYSFEQELIEEGLPDEIIDTAVSLIDETYEYYRTGEGYEALLARLEDPANAVIVKEPFFRRFLLNGGELPEPAADPEDWTSIFVDYLQYWRQLSAPVLALWGGDDNQVPPETSRANIETALKEAGNENYQLMILEDANHSLYVDHDDGDPWQWQRTAPGFQEAVKEWLLER